MAAIGVEIAPAAEGRAPDERPAFLGRLLPHQAVTQMPAVVGQAAQRARQNLTRQVAEARLRGRRILYPHRFVKRVDRKSVGTGKNVASRVDLGGRRNIKKKTKT